jgi:hypothetical protein
VRDAVRRAARFSARTRGHRFADGEAAEEGFIKAFQSFNKIFNNNLHNAMKVMLDAAGRWEEESDGDEEAQTAVHWCEKLWKSMGEAKESHDQLLDFV